MINAIVAVVAVAAIGLVLPSGERKNVTWYELTVEQAEWLSDQLRRTL